MRYSSVFKLMLAANLLVGAAWAENGRRLFDFYLNDSQVLRSAEIISEDVESYVVRVGEFDTVLKISKEKLKRPPVPINPDSVIAKPESYPSYFRLLAFRFQQLTAYQSGTSNGYVFTGLISYNPAFHLGKWLEFRLNFGWAPFVSSVGTRFHVLENSFLAGFALSKHWLIEMGSGAQVWTSAQISERPPITTSSINPIFSANILYRPSNPVFRIIDRLMIGYSLVATLTPIHNFRAGLQVSFW